MALSGESIARIIAEVGRVPQELYRDELRRNIQAALDAYQTDVDENSAPTRRRQSADAAKIVQLARELFNLLEHPEQRNLIDAISIGFPICEGAPVLGAEWENGPGGRPMYRADDPLRRREEPSFHGLKAGLKKLGHAAEEAALKPSPRHALIKAMGVTPLAWLIGKELPDIYKLSFQRRAGRSHPTNKDGAPRGPFVRFVGAVMQEFGRPVSKHTIEAAIKRIRSRLKAQGLKTTAVK